MHEVRIFASAGTASRIVDAQNGGYTVGVLAQCNCGRPAKTMIGPNYWVVPALPHDQLQAILRKHGVLKN